MAETKEAQSTPTPQPTFNPMAFPQQVFEPAFERNPDQEEWIRLERERAERDNAASNALMKKVAESGIMFHNIPGNNTQFIGKVDKSKPVQDDGVTTSAIRSVPLGPEAFSPGREVRWPDGSRTILPPNITSVEQIIHPLTGESLIEPVTAADIKAAGTDDVRDGGALGAEVRPVTPVEVKAATKTAGKPGRHSKSAK